MLNFPEYLVILGGNEVVTRGATGDEFYQLLPEKEDTTYLSATNSAIRN